MPVSTVLAYADFNYLYLGNAVSIASLPLWWTKMLHEQQCFSPVCSQSAPLCLVHTGISQAWSSLSEPQLAFNMDCVKAYTDVVADLDCISYASSSNCGSYCVL